jgi:hypothetical protein
MSSRPLEDERAQPHIGASIGVSWLTPLMVIAGAWATRDFWRQTDWPLWLALAVLLAAMWSLVWSTITGVRWAALLSGWRAWAQGAPLPALPYTQPGSDAAVPRAAAGTSQELAKQRRVAVLRQRAALLCPGGHHHSRVSGRPGNGRRPPESGERRACPDRRAGLSGERQAKCLYDAVRQRLGCRCCWAMPPSKARPCRLGY